ncbi:MAG: tetratricopeptide repeat protein [Elusimicrobia bacterium]|nr:tetratricopeptide repeat protein [Elusimicrobiota bacterium]
MTTSGVLPIALLAAAAVQGGDDFLSLVRKAGNRREPEERVEYYTRALSAWAPGHGAGLLAACRFGRGEARYETGRFAEALPDLEGALEGDPGNARALFLRGRILLHQAYMADEPSPDAVRLLTEYAALKPEDPEGLIALGRAQLLARRFEAARASFGLAARLAPSDPRPRLGSGRAFRAQRRWVAAREELDSAEALAKSRDPDVPAERAAWSLAQGDEKGALAGLDRALPRQEELLLELVRSRALPVEVFERQAAAGRAYLGRGTLRENRGDAAGAREDYEAGCRHGDKSCCARAEALRKAPARKTEAAPPIRPKPAPKRRRPRLPEPESAPGERIYGS